jgi:hypothetical protein
MMCQILVMVMLLIQQRVFRKFITEIMASVIIFMGTHETLSQLLRTSTPVRILIIFLFYYD